jgi:hypothetical protein
MEDHPLRRCREELPKKKLDIFFETGKEMGLNVLPWINPAARRCLLQAGIQW